MTDVAGNLQRLREAIARAATACGRDPATVKLLAVGKTFPADVVLQAFQAGQQYFGENRVQEAAEKIPQLPDSIEWHLIGHLQSNKARRAVELFNVVQSVDSVKIAGRLGRIAADLGKCIPVFVEVNIGRESQKHGVLPEKVGEVLAEVDRYPSLKPVGLMALPPFHPDPERSRPYFQQLRELNDELNRSRERPLTELSMGMTGDFEVAIEEGATWIRVGTAIFGERR